MLKNKNYNTIISTVLFVFVTLIIVIVAKKLSDEGLYRLLDERYIGTSNPTYNVIHWEPITTKGNKAVLSGYTFQVKIPETTERTPLKMYLHDVESGKNTWVKLDMENRPDVESYYADGTDYTTCGFIGTISARKLKGKTYQVYICYNSAQSYTCMDLYIVDGQIVPSICHFNDTGSAYWTPVSDINAPAFANVELQDIISKATLKQYIEQTDTYVYQLDDKIYVVSGSAVKNDKSQVDITFYTNQIEKVTSEQVSGNYGYIRESVNFNDNTDANLSSDEYSVIYVQLPDDIAIVCADIVTYDIDGVSCWGRLSVDACL